MYRRMDRDGTIVDLWILFEGVRLEKIPKEEVKGCERSERNRCLGIYKNMDYEGTW